MHLPRRSPRLRMAAAALVAASLALAGCSNSADAQEPEPAADTLSETSSDHSTSGRVTAPRAPSTAPVPSALSTGFERLGIGPNVGVVLAPVGGGAAIALGDQTPRVAWSTIKVPLSLAALRNNSDPATRATVRSAIINSDNDAALILRRSLGDPTAARAAVTDVLRDLGDETTRVVRITQPDEETFGLTVWPLAAAATFAANLPCQADTSYLMSLMGQVAENQHWGVYTMRSAKATVVKGGWGPGDEGGYEVRQLGVITHPDGQQTAVTMSTYTPGEPFESGTATLDKVAVWLNKNLSSLPRGTCQ